MLHRQAQIWSRKKVKMQAVICLKCVARIQLGPEIMVTPGATPISRSQTFHLKTDAANVVAHQRLQAIDDLIGPKALQPMKQLVERGEFVGIDAAGLLQSARVLLT
jgi:hypothetical protein